MSVETVNSTTEGIPSKEDKPLINTDLSSDMVNISVEELIIGRTIENPIYDGNHILLLAEKSEITVEIKSNLKTRLAGQKIQISKSDLGGVTLRNIDFSENISFHLDEDLTRKIDFILDNKLLKIENEGPALKEQIVPKGRTNYNQDDREKLIKEHAENEKQISSLLEQTLQGENTDGLAMANIATSYLKSMVADTDNVLTSTIDDSQDDNIVTKSLDTALLAMAIAIDMDFDEENIKHLGIAGLLHDWGMCRIPLEIRNSPKRFSRIERLELEKHPIHSFDMLNQISRLPQIVPIVAYQVHERPNGSGYPRGRAGEQIPILSRIIAVADSFISLTRKRPFRPPLSRYAAMETVLRLSKERALDPNVVRSLLNIQSLFPIGSFVSLSDGSVAQVIRANSNNYTKPIIQRIQDQEGKPVNQSDDSHLIDLSESDLTVQEAHPAPGSEEVTNACDHLPFCTDEKTSAQNAKKGGI